MTVDPYSPPAETDSTTPERRSVLSFAGLVLAAMLTAILVLIGLSSAYQNYQLLASFDYAWQRLPTYLLLLPLTSLTCAVMMAFAARSFGQNRPRRGISWFVVSAVGFFGMPRALLSILY
ncbi:MAG: hypothetical protein AAGJ40_11980 [Planctomycetota bacterium]